MVGAPGAQYVGIMSASTGPRRIPGTGGINPPGYGDDAGTGFYSPLGEPILCFFCLMLVYVCVKPIVKSLKSHSMKRLLSLFCLLCLTGPGLFCPLLSGSGLTAPFLSAATRPRTDLFTPLPLHMRQDYDAANPLTFASAFTHSAVTRVVVRYTRLDAVIFGEKPHINLYVDGQNLGSQVAPYALFSDLTFYLDVPYSPSGHTLHVGGTSITRLYDPVDIYLLSITCYVLDSVVDIYYADNPCFAHDTCRHTLSSDESRYYSGWRAHRLFTPGAWETFCLPLPVDCVYTYEDDGSLVHLLPATLSCPDGHYWLRSFRDPCLEGEVATNWLVPESLTLPEPGVGYILMLPDDPWWQDREIIFQGRFAHAGGAIPLSDDYSESPTRALMAPSQFMYVANTTFLAQPVGEGWMPNIPESAGRYFDNHGEPYTLQPMQCHLIGGSATRGIRRVGASNPDTDHLSNPDTPTGLNPSPSMLDPPFLDSETTPRPVKRLVNGRLLIFTPSGTYDLLAYPQ